MNKIFHIPHSSKKIPKEFIGDFIISNEDLMKECEIMCDDYTDVLIQNYPHIVKFDYSRLLCDVERFNDDTEIMNKIGMGVLYTHSHDGELIRNVNDKNKSKIIELYDNHHYLLNNLAKKLLKKNNSILIVDIHSYSNEPLEYELNKHQKRPDVCLGVDEYHNDKHITSQIKYIFENMGFSVELNQPFSGCIIPSDFYHTDNRVKGIMLEFNKKTLATNLEKIKKILERIILL